MPKCMDLQSGPRPCLYLRTGLRKSCPAPHYSRGLSHPPLLRPSGFRSPATSPPSHVALSAASAFRVRVQQSRGSGTQDARSRLQAFLPGVQPQPLRKDSGHSFPRVLPTVLPSMPLSGLGSTSLPKGSEATAHSGPFLCLRFPPTCRGTRTRSRPGARGRTGTVTEREPCCVVRVKPSPSRLLHPTPWGPSTRLRPGHALGLRTSRRISAQTPRGVDKQAAVP